MTERCVNTEKEGCASHSSYSVIDHATDATRDEMTKITVTCDHKKDTNTMNTICWCCGDGEEETITRHHAIPKAMNPINNWTVPLCHTCHLKLHQFYALQYGPLSKRSHEYLKEREQILRQKNIQGIKKASRIMKEMGRLREQLTYAQKRVKELEEEIKK